MKYGKCEDCGEYVRYQEVPLCNSCREKVIARLNECARNGCRSLNDFLRESGLHPRRVRYFVLNGYVKLDEADNQNVVKEIEDEQKQTKIDNLNLAKELKQSFENVELNNGAPKGTVGIKNSTSGARMHIDIRRHK